MAHRGRPSEYKPEYVQVADKYLKQCKDEEYDWTKTDGTSSTSYEHRIKVKLPTIEGFSLFLDVNTDSLYEWSKHYPDFSEALSKIKKEQFKRVLEKGLSGDYNPVIAKLILSANHGMREKTDITTDGKELPTPMYGSKAE